MEVEQHHYLFEQKCDHCGHRGFPNSLLESHNQNWQMSNPVCRMTSLVTIWFLQQSFFESHSQKKQGTSMYSVQCKLCGHTGFPGSFLIIHIKKKQSTSVKYEVTLVSLAVS